MRLGDKVAIVTGGGRGIGRGIATVFAREGAKVVIASRTEAAIFGVARDIEAAGGTARAVVTDVSRSHDVEQMIRFTMEQFGRIDVLVNNSGIGGFGLPIDDPEVEEAYDRLLATNLKGIWMATHCAVPHMKRAGGGVIINIASVHAWGASANNSAYSASKGGIIAGTRGLAVELAPFLIRVNAISPGAILVGDLADHVAQAYGESRRREFVARFSQAHEAERAMQQPLPMVGMPEDVANCALYLASDESRFVTGTNITVDGGMTALLAGPMPIDPEKTQQIQEMRSWLAGLEKRD
jgi:NAD(P)-dependent dehydrogenase (short-subunit alcohol dehydrogenase family)